MKKQPQRTCMGCSEKKDKKEFIRIVKNKNTPGLFHIHFYQSNGKIIYIQRPQFLQAIETATIYP